MTEKVIIIGGGIAGLSAGCYAQINGYDSEIYEMHNIPGGLCTAWKRQGYTFDGCIHWLVGSKEGTSMHKVWKRIGALTDQPIHHHEEFTRVSDSSGRTAIQYTNLDRLEQHLLQLSPGDEQVIRELVNGARKLEKIEMPVGKPQELSGLTDGMKMMWEMRPFLGVMSKYSKISIGEFTARFKDPLVRELFSSIIDPRYYMMALMATMGSLAAKDAGWPQGGSMVFAQQAARRYEELGGKIHYKSRVNKIIVEENRAVGIELDNGERVEGVVISAADGYTTLFKLLGEEYVPEKIGKYYTDQYPTITSVIVFLGVDFDFSNTPHSSIFPLDKPLEIGGRVQKNIGFKNYCFDPTMSPPEKSVVGSVMYTENDYWENLYSDREKYNKEKELVAQQVIREFEKNFPQASGKVEVIDVVTPVTFTRYTGAWKGAYMSWISTPKSGMLRLPKQLPGLKDFYMAGLWTMASAGLPGAAITGREVIQILCAKDKKQFIGEED